MTEFQCSLGYRPRIGPRSICGDCTNKDCTNPIYEVNVTTHLPQSKLKGGERLWLENEEKPKEKRTLHDYYCVLDCEGFKDN